MRPKGKVVVAFDVTNLGDQLIAHRGGWRGREDKFLLPRLVDRAGRWFAVGRLALASICRSVDHHRRGFGEDVGSIEIILAGNADQCKQPAEAHLSTRRFCSDNRDQLRAAVWGRSPRRMPKLAQSMKFRQIVFQLPRWKSANRPSISNISAGTVPAGKFLATDQSVTQSGDMPSRPANTKSGVNACGK